MKIYFDYNKIPSQAGTVVTLGNFDGFHLGHQKIVRQTIAMARTLRLPALVITFHPHPRQLLSQQISVLTPLERKVELFRAAGADMVLVQPFTRAFAGTDPREFIRDVLFYALNCRHVVVGYDYSFGRGGAGDTNLMKAMAAQLGIGCEIVPPVTNGGEVISSTAVRKYLNQGDVETAARYMGRYYALSGRVEAGEGRGKQLGFPTANLYPARAVALPAFGVYAVKVEIAGREYRGVANIGLRPTFPAQRPALEIHILEFSGNLYGHCLTVHFLKKLRDEIKFPDVDSFKRQVKEDIRQVVALLGNSDMLKWQRI
ncbi:MAG: bifunctional riboflavin kinase/FAD synthetase [Firmicutes bacterium]|nr:bifunctional riboflavin kinase/FAD synthetase [Bacillota bacterium]HOB34493.1 bifunctional riboflavin kinase/FAD synthetase [Bacillota bacterium]HPZ90101.1 bifunctional riboflavin kinase/FAD synthetase [Bacillota bacterium]HQE01047.1 bifunctional riboflavin kinase/FAD synthetase [Bacillota bacterium]